MQRYFKNTATEGGAIYNANILTDTSSTFTYNEANKGGAIYNTGNIVTYNAKTGAVTGGLKSTKFTENKAVLGGAIYNEATANIIANNTNVIFSENKVGNSLNDIYNSGTLNLKAKSGKSITFGGTITDSATPSGTTTIGNFYQRDF